MILFTSNVILFLIFFVFITIYKIILQDVLLIEIFQAIFLENGIIYIFLARAFLFLRKYLLSILEKTQITKLKKMVLILNNEI